MKRTAALVLSLSLLGSNAFALTTNRGDINDAHANGQRLTKIQRARLQSKVILAYILRGDIRWRQGLVDAVGVDHRVSPGAIFLGATTVGAEALLGATAYKALADRHFGAYDRAMDAHYKAYTEQADRLNGLRSEVATLRAEGATASAKPSFVVKPGEPEPILPAEAPGAAVGTAAKDQRLAEKEADILTAEAALKDLQNKKGLLSKETKLVSKTGRVARLTLGALVVPITIYEVAATAYQILYDPQHVDQIEQQLTDFIDDARVTLDNQ